MTALYLVCLRDRPVTTHVPLFIKTLSFTERNCCIVRLLRRRWELL